jgi:uncharacterized tellurite resistance protein B-like protein
MPWKELIERLRAAPPAPPSGLAFPRRELAVAALLVETAQVDRETTGEERALVLNLIGERLGLPAAAAGRLLCVAEGEFSAALDDWVFTLAVRESFPEAERVEVLEMMWRIVYADGRLARFEEQLMKRMPVALGLTTVLAEEARARAFARAPAKGRGA